MVKGGFFLILILFASSVSALVIDHTDSLNFNSISDSDFDLARKDLHIVYIHTSYGSHITNGMKAIASMYGTAYAYANSDNEKYLDLDDKTNFGLCDDLSQCSVDTNEDGIADWYNLMKEYLNNNQDVNIVMWSWGNISNHNVQLYIDTMEKLILEYPRIKFIFMTGHSEGQGETTSKDSVHYNNELIRNHVIENNRILFDFADIESYDPDGNYYWDKNMQANLDYIINQENKNWGVEWISSNPESELVQVSSKVASCAYSDYELEMNINCALKGLAAWSLWTKVAKIISSEELSCLENWICSDWGECLSGKKNRVCTDTNLCLTISDKPEEELSCIVVDESDPDTINSTTEGSDGLDDNYTDSSNTTLNDSEIEDNTKTEEDEPIEILKEEEYLNKISLVSDQGKINFKEDIIITESISVAGKVIINHNRIYIDSEALPEFNVSARLELENITFNNPRILRNGEICPESICTFIDYSNSRLIFDVSSFSEYSSDEMPVCGDNVCHKEENCELCSVDCGECYQVFSSDESTEGVEQGEEYVFNKSNKAILIIIVFALIILLGLSLVIVKLIQIIKKRKKKGESFSGPKIIKKEKK